MHPAALSSGSAPFSFLHLRDGFTDSHADLLLTACGVVLARITILGCIHLSCLMLSEKGRLLLVYRLKIAE